MKKTIFKVSIIVLGIAFLTYSAFLYKKSFVDKGYGDKDVEKEILLGYYVLFLKLENTKENRDKFRSMTIAELKKILNIDNIEPNIN